MNNIASENILEDGLRDNVKDISSIVESFTREISSYLSIGQSTVIKMGDKVVKIYLKYGSGGYAAIILYHFIHSYVSSKINDILDLDEPIVINGKDFSKIRIRVLDLDYKNVGLCSQIKRFRGKIEKGKETVAINAKFISGETLGDHYERDVNQKSCCISLLKQIKAHIENKTGIVMEDEDFDNNSLHPINIKICPKDGLLELIITDLAINVGYLAFDNASKIQLLVNSLKFGEFESYIFSLYSKYCNSSKEVSSGIIRLLFGIYGIEGVKSFIESGKLNITKHTLNSLCYHVGVEFVMEIIFSGNVYVPKDIREFFEKDYDEIVRELKLNHLYYL